MYSKTVKEHKIIQAQHYPKTRINYLNFRWAKMYEIKNINEQICIKIRNFRWSAHQNVEGLDTATCTVKELKISIFFENK